jgi:hypothetical protein
MHYPIRKAALPGSVAALLYREGGTADLPAALPICPPGAAAALPVEHEHEHENHERVRIVCERVDVVTSTSSLGFLMI